MKQKQETIEQRDALALKRRALVGEVVSNKMAKTIVVKVERILRHPEYNKVVRQHKKYKVHDEQGAAVGSIVEIVPCRPLSKTKHMVLRRIIQHQQGA